MPFACGCGTRAPPPSHASDDTCKQTTHANGRVHRAHTHRQSAAKGSPPRLEGGRRLLVPQKRHQRERQRPPLVNGRIGAAARWERMRRRPGLPSPTPAKLMPSMARCIVRRAGRGPSAAMDGGDARAGVLTATQQHSVALTRYTATLHQRSGRSCGDGFRAGGGGGDKPRREDAPKKDVKHIAHRLGSKWSCSVWQARAHSRNGASA